MKILHIAQERGTALVAAGVVHGIAQNVALTWAPTPASALQWLQGNSDTAAVIVEVQAQSCASFVEDIRGLGLTTPVVVVAGSTRLESALGALNSGADGYVVAGPSLESDLPRTVAGAIDRERSRQQLLAKKLTALGAEPARARQQLVRVEEAHRQSEERRTSELAAATARLADIEARHSVSLTRETRICTALQQRLFELESALRTADERRAAEAGAFADQFARRHAEFTVSLAQAAQARDALAVESSVATAALDEARQARRADAAAAAEHLRRREAELRADLAEAVAGRNALANALAELDAAHQDTRQRAAVDLAAANERQAALEDLLTQETDRRTSLDGKLTAAGAAHQEAEQRHAAELTRVETGLSDLQGRYDAALAESATARATFERQTAEATSALEQASQERTAEAAAAAAQLASMEAALGGQLAEAATARTALERTLADAQSAQQHAMRRATEDLASAEARQRSLEDRLAQETDRRTSLDGKLTAAEAAHQEAERRHAAELTGAAASLAELQAQYDAALEESAAARAAFQRQTAEAASALERASRERTEETAAATAQFASMEAELGARLAETVAAKTALERTLADAQSAQQHATQRAAEDLASAEARQRALEGRLAQETDRGMGLERLLSAAETALQDTDRRHASALAAAAADFASLQARHDTAVTEHAAAHAALEQRLIDVATAHQQAEDRTAAALAAASAREAELVEKLTRESDARAALERDLTAARMESVRGRDRTLSVISASRRRGREQKAGLEAQSHLEQETLRRLLGTTQDELQHLHGTVEEERQAHERARLTSDSELQRVSAEYDQIRQSFDQLQSAFQTLEQIAAEHAAERARLEAVVAERDSQLSAQAERHAVAEESAQDALAELQEMLRQTLDSGGSEIARLQQGIDNLRRELDASRTHAEALRGVAERVPDLQTQLERSQTERRRQFERAPYALCRCSQNGAITDANHSFVTLLGCRRVEDLRNTDFVAAALDSAGDLGWLLERARTTRKTETVETHWKTRDGRRLVVRLQALANTTGSTDIVAEDITGVRALEERLRQAQRMEAVGRLASELAVTCDALLSDVSRGAHEWLDKVGSDDTLRGHAERLLTDVTRASSFLRQLGTYGNEQVRALEPVSVQLVLRDLAPVLQRLVGDQIQLVLPKSAGSFNVDVDAERLERVLINVASYARERMTSGGQVRIDLATTAVGRRFVARYANVRPGDHVLITVTELPGVADLRGDSERSSRSSDKPGVDLGVLLELIASCGGHLWLEAQPAGNMVVKIHLPKPPAANATDNRGKRLSRWFRSTPTANVRV
jgi:signal transduction histidine kinase/coenzyme F420-reducing hydrogenase delta subunit